MADFRSVKVGDRVVRLLAGELPMELVVTEVSDGVIVCGGPEGWRFDRATGIEVDEELGWGPRFGITGSYLLLAEAGKLARDPELARYPSGCLDAADGHGPAHLHAGHAGRECAAAGLEPGWRSLIDRLYDIVEPARARGDDVAVTQVKQTWGELRIHLAGAQAGAIEPLVAQLREASRRNCEGCGAPALDGPRDVLRGLAQLPRVRTYCDACFAAARIGEPRRTLSRLGELLREVERRPELPH